MSSRRRVCLTDAKQEDNGYLESGNYERLHLTSKRPDHGHEQERNNSPHVHSTSEGQEASVAG